jgi:3'-5' exoribonuclease
MSKKESYPPPAGRRFITGLATGDAVDEVYYLQEVDERTTRDGRPYLALRLSDRSGHIDARAWERARELKLRLAGDSFARIRGIAESFRGRLQVRVESAEPVAATGLDQRDFLPSSYRDISELTGFLDYFLTEVYDPDYARLLASFFTDPEFMKRFCLAPGDARSHHAYLGGLLEHTVSVATLCQHTVVQHPRLRSDLLITAALLHDVGKMDEFSYEGRIRLSRPGRLLGHVLLGQRIIERRLAEMEGFPQEKELELIHAVISHHGELEWGAPKRPQSAEALVLHHLDNLDARVKGFFEIVEGSGELPWSELKNYFRRPLDEPVAADREPSPDRRREP